MADVEAAGYKLETDDAAHLMGIYSHEFGRAAMTRKFIDTLQNTPATDGRPLVDEAAPRPFLAPDATPREIEEAKQADRSDYIRNDNLRALGQLGVHPEVAQKVGNVLGTSALRNFLSQQASNPFVRLGQAAVKGLEKAQSIAKQTMFDASPFHFTTEALHSTGHGVNPFGAIEHFDPTNARHMELLRGGLMLVPDAGGAQRFAEGVTGGSDSLVRKIPGVGKVAAQMGDYLFHEFIPSLKLKTASKLLDRNLHLFSQEMADGKLSREDVAALSADQANAAYGHLNFVAMARNPTAQHIFGLAALAPDFLEARLRFTAQAAQGIAGKIGREQLKAMGILFFSQFVLTRLWNKAMDDDYHFDEPFSAFYHGRSYTLRSVPEDVWKSITHTAQFISGRESPALRTGIQLLTGRNYRGERTDAVDTLREAAASAVPISVRDLPGFNSLSTTQKNSTSTALETMLGACGFHVARVSPENDVYALADKFKRGQGIQEDTGSHPVSKFQPLKYALEDQNMDRAKSEWEKLAGKDGDPQKVQKLAVGFRSSIQHPFTKTAAMDQEFAATLKGDDLKKYNDATAQRQETLQRFRSMLGLDAPADDSRARALASLAAKRGNGSLAKAMQRNGAVPAGAS